MQTAVHTHLQCNLEHIFDESIFAVAIFRYRDLDSDVYSLQSTFVLVATKYN